MKKKTAPHVSLPVLIVTVVALFLALYGLKMIIWPSATFDSHSASPLEKEPERLSASELVGSYSAEVPTTDAPKRTLRLLLISNGVATLSIDYHNSQPPLVQSGVWTSSPPNFAIVTLNQQGESALSPPVLVRFEKANRYLLAVEYDRHLFGTTKLKLLQDETSPTSAPTPY
jgi:hypothetical protein